ncbi:MAG: hypothetical protein ABIG20_03445 [archaeon]
MKSLLKGLFSARYTEDEIAGIYAELKKACPVAKLVEGQNEKIILLNGKKALIFTNRLGKFVAKIDEFALTKEEYSVIQESLGAQGITISAPGSEQGKLPMDKWLRYSVFGLFGFGLIVSAVLIAIAVQSGDVSNQIWMFPFLVLVGLISFNSMTKTA